MNTDIFKEKLEKELVTVEGELEKIARRNPLNPEDWEPIEAADDDRIDDDSVADNLEEFATNTALVRDLETQYDDIKIALEKIKEGKYGICEVSGEPIPEERLKANPSARTCVEHTN